MERLQKILARAGFGSRRKCEQLITSGRVAVNGVVTDRLGSRADPERDTVTVDGIPVDARPDKRYLLLNKPRGYITSVGDPQGRPTVMDLLPPYPGIFPVGRLDFDTRGLLLVTNDGFLANRVMHPRYALEKTYAVQARGELAPGKLASLRTGIELEDGVTSPADVRVLGESGDRVRLEMRIHEGRNRQVRRMLDAVGLEVVDLVRTAVGPLRLSGLEEGAYRELHDGEQRDLRLALSI